jgi:hypothetical protein
MGVFDRTAAGAVVRSGVVLRADRLAVGNADVCGRHSRTVISTGARAEVTFRGARSHDLILREYLTASAPLPHLLQTLVLIHCSSSRSHYQSLVLQGRV